MPVTSRIGVACVGRHVLVLVVVPWCAKSLTYAAYCAGSGRNAVRFVGQLPCFQPSPVSPLLPSYPHHMHPPHYHTWVNRIQDQQDPRSVTSADLTIFNLGSYVCVSSLPSPLLSSLFSSLLFSSLLFSSLLFSSLLFSSLLFSSPRLSLYSSSPSTCRPV